MSKLTIYVSPLKLQRIRSYSEEKKVSLSSIFVRGALAIVNSQPVRACSFCKNSSLGHFELSVYDLNLGENKRVVDLCEFHLKKAKGEGEVREL